MDLGTFHSEISAHIRRGTSMDALIPGFVRRAAFDLEKNYGFQYMRQVATITIDPAVDLTPQYIDLSSIQLKMIRGFRWEPADGSDFIYLTKVNFGDFLGPETGVPRYYWLDGTARIVLGSVPTDTLYGKLYLSRYSSWPTLDAETHWLLENAEQALIHGSLVNFGLYSRDMELVAAHRLLLKGSLELLIGVEIESEWSDTDMAMGGG